MRGRRRRADGGVDHDDEQDDCGVGEVGGDDGQDRGGEQDQDERVA
jgi:hypothetical protein